MKINWKVRFKNKTFVVTLITAFVAFIYQILSIFEIVPSISQDNVMNLIFAAVTLLTSLGIIVDPTTEGINDSLRAQNYTELGGGEHDFNQRR